MGPRWNSKFELKPGKWVFVPTLETVERGKEIKADLESRWSPPKFYFHLRAGGHVAALQSHLGQRCFIHLDVQGFFDSINRTRITRSLKGLYSYNDARTIANDSTVISPGVAGRKFILPYGFVQSPMLASLCLYKSALGRCLKNLTRRDGVKVSVYVDDIIISTRDQEEAIEILSEVKSAADRAGFVLNELKEEGPSPQIRAFNIELSEHSLAIEAERRDEFLQALRTSSNGHQRKGILGYVESVNPDQALALAKAI